MAAVNTTRSSIIVNNRGTYFVFKRVVQGKTYVKLKEIWPWERIWKWKLDISHICESEIIPFVLSLLYGRGSLVLPLCIFQAEGILYHKCVWSKLTTQALQEQTSMGKGSVEMAVDVVLAFSQKNKQKHNHCTVLEGLLGFLCFTYPNQVE